MATRKFLAVPSRFPPYYKLSFLKPQTGPRPDQHHHHRSQRPHCVKKRIWQKTLFFSPTFPIHTQTQKRRKKATEERKKERKREKEPFSSPPQSTIDNVLELHLKTDGRTDERRKTIIYYYCFFPFIFKRSSVFFSLYNEKQIEINSSFFGLFISTFFTNLPLKERRSAPCTTPLIPDIFVIYSQEGGKERRVREVKEKIWRPSSSRHSLGLCQRLVSGALRGLSRWYYTVHKLGGPQV